MLKTVVLLMFVCGSCFGDEPRTALIPFSNEIPTQVDMERQKRSPLIASFHAPTTTVEHRPGVISITTGSATLPQYLVWDCKCPEWVVEYYKGDMSNQIRILKGYEYLSDARRAQEYADKDEEWSKLKTRAFDRASLTDSERELQKSGFLKSRDYWLGQKRKHETKFKMLKVTEPEGAR